ncbi:cysteine-rich small domain-containing protein [Cellulosilyticum ruminicola]|uniref:cysteine-rich small domain-containing protein n=1 Tax=Cellulosilyticum ruminicola TaxID=425254 RepID=UPI0006CFE9E6|nr:cysteine-rich small domain-containing protein [Cellulosilyticum ruminicola]
MAYYKFFQNKQCEYFPCHKVKDEETFNCLFCYCPLYALGDKCGGGFEYTAKGIKSCMKCTKTHGSNGYEYVMEKMKEVMALAKEVKSVDDK